MKLLSLTEPLMMRLVKALVEDWVVKPSVDPVDAVVGEE